MKVFVFTLLALTSCAVFRPASYVAREKCEESITIYKKEPSLKYYSIVIIRAKTIDELKNKACKIDSSAGGLILIENQDQLKASVIEFVE